MEIKTLLTPWQRSRGAMFQKSLGATVLFFAYPHTAPRLFHTFFCPPLRIIVLDEQGEVLFDQVVPPDQIVRLPAARLIVEADPAQTLPPALLSDLAQNAPQLLAGSGQ